MGALRHVRSGSESQLRSERLPGVRRHYEFVARHNRKETVSRHALAAVQGSICELTEGICERLGWTSS